MKLNLNSVVNERDKWLGLSYSMPEFDIADMRERTLRNPKWLHFGAGNIFRMFPARLLQELINKGLEDTGVIVCESYDTELVSRVFEPYDNLSVAVSLRADSSVEKTVVAVVADCFAACDGEDRLEKMFENESLQAVSFTITEKGYAQSPLTEMLVRLLKKRYDSCGAPVALVSMDNCSNNGDKLRETVMGVAQSMGSDTGFIDYLQNAVKYPLTMIDKITPRPSEKVKEMLVNDGLTGMDIIETSKHTFASCFVNAEKTEYLVIEDSFPNGRPVWDKAGVIFTDRKTVEAVESMKVRTCLNPLHTAMGVFGCMLGFTSISAEMSDPHITGLIKRIGFDEGMPVVVDPGIINPLDFINEVINERFPNPYVPDTPQRIVCDSSQKIPVRFGETLKAYAARGKEGGIAELTYIPLFIAGWVRFLSGIDDEGNVFEVSPDPMLGELRERLKTGVHGIFSDASIFGVDLYEYGLGEKTESFYNEMQGVGAVRRTLAKYLG